MTLVHLQISKKYTHAFVHNFIFTEAAKCQRIEREVVQEVFTNMNSIALHKDLQVVARACTEEVVECSTSCHKSFTIPK